MNLDEFEEFPDKTIAELKADEDEEVDWAKAEDEFEGETEEFHRLAEVIYSAIILGEMFQQNYITLREYMALTEYLEDIERDLDISLI